MSDYLIEGTSTSLNVSRLVFLSESSLREEPFRNESCFEFEENFNVNDIGTMSADNLVANVIALFFCS